MTFGERVGGLFQIMTAIGGMAALLNPFGMMDAILSLLGLDFYRNKLETLLVIFLMMFILMVLMDKEKYRKNPKTGRWEEIGPDGKPVKPVKPGTTKPGTTKPTNY